jgi:hypothetical protein
VLRAPFPWIWPLIFLTYFCLFFNTGPNVRPSASRKATTDGAQT